MWNENERLFLDYNAIERKQTSIRSLATLFPLYCEIATPPQARAVRDNLSRFEQSHGLSACDQDYGYHDRQWNCPVGWPPLHWIAHVALMNYGMQDDARRIALKWLGLNLRVWKETGKLYEKYNVVDGSLSVLDNRYKNQEGFGWTNAIFHLLSAGLRPDLRLMSRVSNISGIPTSGMNLVIVANVKGVLHFRKGVLHFRIFNADGEWFLDTDETSLPTQAGPIAELRKQLENLWPPYKLKGPEKDRIIAKVTSIVGLTPDQDQGDGEGPAEEIVTALDKLKGDYSFKTDYDNLNKEIIDNSNKIYQIIQIVFTSVPLFLAGVLALGKRDGEERWWFVSITSLLVFAIIIPSVVLVTSSLKSTVRISQYLRLRYFPPGKLKGWEYYIQFFRVTAPKNKYRSFGKGLTWIFAGLSLLTILVSLLSFLVCYSQPEVSSGRKWFYFFAVVLAACVSSFVIRSLNRCWLTEAFTKSHDRWKLIDETMKEGITLDEALKKGITLDLVSSPKNAENNQMLHRD